MSQYCITDETLNNLKIVADVVYDPDVVRSLVKLLSNILRCSSPQVIICSTVRNQETYGGFKQQLGILIDPHRLSIHFF